MSSKLKKLLFLILNIPFFSSGEFGKYVKVEIFSHYGNEHYCPVSLFRIFGIDQLELIADIGKKHAFKKYDQFVLILAVFDEVP